MLRVFKVTSPMSVGSWVLAGLGRRVEHRRSARADSGILQPLKALAERVAFASGPPLATYTGALLANTAIPVWSEARDELPWLFGASAAASAGAAAAICHADRSAGPARRAAVGGVVAELGVMQAMERRLGFVGEVYQQGEAGRYASISKALHRAGAGAARGGRQAQPRRRGGRRRARARRRAGAALVGVQGGLPVRRATRGTRWSRRRSASGAAKQRPRPSRQLSRLQLLFAVARDAVRRRAGPARDDLGELRPHVVDAHAVVCRDALREAAVDSSR